MNKTARTAILQEQRTNTLEKANSESNWQLELVNACRDPDKLLSRLGLTEILPAYMAADFPFLVPESFIRRMKIGDPNDPLLKQVLPVHYENDVVPNFLSDPVADLTASPVPGMVHKYVNRVLLITSGSCAVNCRYCFRRHFPYSEAPRSLESWKPVFEEIGNRPEVDEVILSGGDPLTLNDRRLGLMIEKLAEIPHLQRIRFHSRLPIVLPSRVTEGLLNALRKTRLQPIFVVHANHGNEIVDDCATALRRLVRAGIPVLNQAVLLRGINDSINAQVDLCTRLVNVGAMPYYLNQLDRVQGAAHFEVSVERGREIMAGLRKNLSGYAVPRYVVDVPECDGKTEL
ncbi:EF-P beta-lysylation protein EpmB [Rubinisphaera italica]|uniref:L-lysine 2,3-aminomutase n=1 Tax=Rubinisphaera italica TaxID=2527969 RepID=A0A5C5X8P6_9PLAN|nr:EF-P beta-lysylation protein EpmB [Rubinisphaera italica]TWT59310.1 L-lysine 2,3-aminomutase [Rubinisphaera italica]